MPRLIIDPDWIAKNPPAFGSMSCIEDCVYTYIIDGNVVFIAGSEEAAAAYSHQCKALLQQPLVKEALEQGGCHDIE